MNSVHDMGGMEGLGRLQIERNEPVFHAAWEGRVMGLNAALSAWRKWNLDVFRHEQERIPAAEYLRMSYYERWLITVMSLAQQAGLVSNAEIFSGRPDRSSAPATPPLRPGMVGANRKGSPKVRPTTVTPLFSLGDHVRARIINPTKHTRLPRYLRGHAGEVTTHHGAHVFPDSNAQFHGESPQHLYTVRFRARDVWGEEANPRDSVYADLWEPYLDHA